MWANVGKILNCVIAMVDRLQGRADRPQEVPPSEQQEAAGDTHSQNTGGLVFQSSVGGMMKISQRKCNIINLTVSDLLLILQKHGCTGLITFLTNPVEYWLCSKHRGVQNTAE